MAFSYMFCDRFYHAYLGYFVNPTLRYCVAGNQSEEYGANSLEIELAALVKEVKEKSGIIKTHRFVFVWTSLNTQLTFSFVLRTKMLTFSIAIVSTSYPSEFSPYN